MPPNEVCDALVADFVKAVVKVPKREKKSLASLLLRSIVKVLRSGQSSKLKFLYIVKLKKIARNLLKLKLTYFSVVGPRLTRRGLVDI